MFSYRSINLSKDIDTIIKFRRDSFVISFGDDKLFCLERYIEKIQERLGKFPKGLVLVEDGSKQVGQIELQITQYQGEKIGYVNLFYLIEPYRGKGFGKELVKYVEQFFIENKINKYHLRVSTTNSHALKFYEKNGFIIVCIEEQDSKPRYRMSKIIEL